MDERELVLTSLIYPLIFREAAQIGVATPIAAHIRELLKIQTPEPEVTKIGLPVPVTASVRNLYQKYVHPLQDYAQIGVAKPVGAYFKNIFNEHIQPIGDTTLIGVPTPVSAHQVNLLKNLQTFKTDHVVQISNAIPEAVYSTCKPVVFAPINLRGGYDGESIQLFWSNSSITHSHQNLYRSTTPFTESNLPPVYQYIFRGINSYIDEDVIEGTTYYYAVSTEAGLVQLVSNVTEVVTVEISNCDPHWDKVVALLHFDGELRDETGREWVIRGSALIEDGYFGGGLQRYGGSSSTYTDSLGLYNDTYTIEFWYRQDSNRGRYSAIFAVGRDNILFRVNPAGGIELLTNNNTWVGSGISPIIGEWYHVCIQRNVEGILGWFIDGIYRGGIARNPANGTVHIGYSSKDPNDAWFTLDELRITKGVARYTENFAPPTEPFPDFGCATPKLPEVIGEEFGGGFYIGDITIPDGPDAGTYAIIMAGIEGQARLAWKNPHSATPGSSSTVDGMANTLAMQADNPDIHYAGMHCLNYRGDGYDDWYMPAVDELNLAWLNRDVLAGLAMESQSYWSSTSTGSTSFYATYQNFSTGAQANSIMSNSIRVRPVRRIKKPD